MPAVALVPALVPALALAVGAAACGRNGDRTGAAGAPATTTVATATTPVASERDATRRYRSTIDLPIGTGTNLIDSTEPFREPDGFGGLVNEDGRVRTGYGMGAVPAKSTVDGKGYPRADPNDCDLTGAAELTANVRAPEFWCVITLGTTTPIAVVRIGPSGDRSAPVRVVLYDMG